MKGLAEILLITGIALWVLFACDVVPIIAPISVNVTQLIYILWLKTSK